MVTRERRRGSAHCDPAARERAPAGLSDADKIAVSEQLTLLGSSPMQLRGAPTRRRATWIRPSRLANPSWPPAPPALQLPQPRRSRRGYGVRRQCRVDAVGQCCSIGANPAAGSAYVGRTTVGAASRSTATCNLSEVGRLAARMQVHRAQAQGSSSHVFSDFWSSPRRPAAARTRNDALAPSAGSTAPQLHGWVSVARQGSDRDPVGRVRITNRVDLGEKVDFDHASMVVAPSDKSGPCSPPVMSSTSWATSSWPA